MCHFFKVSKARKQEDEASMSESGAAEQQLCIPGSGLETMVERDVQGLL